MKMWGRVEHYLLLGGGRWCYDFEVPDIEVPDIEVPEKCDIEVLATLRSQ